MFIYSFTYCGIEHFHSQFWRSRGVRLRLGSPKRRSGGKTCRKALNRTKDLKKGSVISGMEVPGSQGDG
jgi:hypothetical protein